MCCTVDDLTTGLDLVTQKKTNGRFRCSVLWQAGRPRPQSQPAPVPTPKPDQCVHGMGVSSTSAVAAKVLRGPLFSAASELLHQLLPLHHRLSRGISGPNTQEGALPALLSSRPGLLGLGEDECVGSAAVSHFAAASVNCSVPPSLFLLPLLAGMSNISMESRHHSSGEAWQRVSLGMKEVLARHGIDIIVPFSVAWYNSVVPPALRLPWLGRTQPPLGVVVGNSRALWAPFLDALASQPDVSSEAALLNLLVGGACFETELSLFLSSSVALPSQLRKDGHPLNTYIKHALDEALAGFQVLDTHVPGETGRDSDRVRALIYWAHDTAPGKLVAMQRLAHLTGLFSAPLIPVPPTVMTAQAGAEVEVTDWLTLCVATVARDCVLR